ncbi:MAG: peptidylprolyl isomerase [Bacteroidota bacterium]|jgi:peptidyl-prolyl cis-trans isomerase SurA|nr:peptidylprolyl isomerase [Flammeovirgaceae bacterium]MCZ8070436.1 peptidylprolyl isomerase [Cytophagales bacterium]
MRFMRMQQRKKSLKYSTASFVALLWFATAIAQDKTGFVVDKIIAKVDNYIVIKSELEQAYQGYVAEGNPASEEAKCQIFNRLIMNKLMVAKAEIDSVTVTDQEVDQNTTQRMGMIMQSSGNSPEELERRYGKSLDQIKLELRDQIREQLLSREMTQKITKDMKITPAEVKRFFNKIPTDSLPYYSSDVQIGQIVKIAKISAAQEEEAKRRLNELRDRILAGENFNELALKYSEDPSARQNGGEMGFVGRGSMVPPYEAMAFKLRKGEISIPFKSQFGHHIMQLIERRGNEYNSRHILLLGNPSAEDVQRAQHYLDSLRRKIVKDSIKFEYAAKQYSDDNETKGRGGYFTDQDGGTNVSLRDIDPVVYLAIDTMKVGTISKPIAYRTDDGKEAVRILYYKAKLPPHQANLKDDWHRIQSAALAEKRDKAIGKWFNKSKGDVFINIDPEYNSCKILE